MIYLDNAATTLYKPRAVEQAVRRAMYGAAGYARGSYAAAGRAGELVYACREQAAALFGVGEPERVIFTLNATHALNIAVNALVKPDSRVIVSGYEHNAVMRPLTARNIEPTVLDTPLWDGAAMVSALKQALVQGADSDDTEPRFQRIRQHCAAGRNRGIADGGRRAAHPGCVAVGGRGGD